MQPAAITQGDRRRVDGRGQHHHRQPDRHLDDRQDHHPADLRGPQLDQRIPQRMQEGRAKDGEKNPNAQQPAPHAALRIGSQRFTARQACVAAGPRIVENSWQNPSKDFEAAGGRGFALPQRVVAALAGARMPWLPTSGRICQQRSHFAPSRQFEHHADARHFRQAERLCGLGVGGQRDVRGDAEIGEIHRPQRRQRSRVSATCTTGAASRMAPITLAVRCTSSAAGHHAPHLRGCVSHFAASAVIAPGRRAFRASPPDAPSCPRPGSGYSQTSSIVKTRIGASQVVSRWNRMSSTVRQARRRRLPARRSTARPCGCRNRPPTGRWCRR